MNKKKKILITGTGGFIFSNFVRYAIHEKYDHKYNFVSIDKVKKSNVLDNIFTNKNHKFYIGDITNEHFINVIFEYERPDIVINGAAETFVDSSIQNSYPFLHTNIIGTQVIIDACLKWKVDKLVQVSCYDEETKAVTRDGLKTYEELKIGDLVLSINPKTGIIEEKPIEKIIVQDYIGPMFNFQNDRINLNVTPNHRFICSSHCKNNNNLFWKTAEELENSNMKIYLPNSSILKESVQMIEIPELGFLNAAALFYVCGVFIGDGFLAEQRRKFPNKSGFSKKERMIKARDSKGRFIQKINQSKNKQKYSISNSYRIFFDVPENDKARQKLEESLNKLNIKYTCQKNKSGEHIYFGSQKWCNFFKQFGKYAKNKHIPNWMFDHGTWLLQFLWLGLHDSDGHGFCLKQKKTNYKKVPVITTVSKKLMGQLLYLGRMLGSNSVMGKYHSVSYINDRKISGSAYYIRFPNEINALIPKPTKNIYNGKVWCLKIKDNKNFLIERNNKTAFCGNTDEIYGHLENEDQKSWTEESPINPRNPYAASKASAELLIKAAHNTHGLKYNITRSSNNYGPRQNAEKFVPKIIKCILNNESIPVYGQGLQVRDWTYVFDNCEAVFKIIENGQDNEIYNISANQEFSNIEVVQEICNILGQGHDLISFVKDRPGHDFRYSVDSSKVKKLGWEPKFKFKDTIPSVVQWYKNNQWFLKL